MAEGSALSGASLLISLGLVSRLLTFAANQALLRLLDAPLLGFAARLEGFYLAVVFFAREAVRVAVQRQPGRVSGGGPIGGKDGPGDGESKDGGPKDSGGPADKSEPKHASTPESKAKAQTAEEGQAVVNISYIPPLLGALVSLLLGYAMLSDSPAHEQVSFNEALALYALAAALELLSEPAFALTQLRLKLGTRAGAEALGGAARCAATLFSAWRASSGGGAGAGVLPFAYGQVAYGGVLLVVYGVVGLGIARRGGFSIFPRSVRNITKKPQEENRKGGAEERGANYLLGYLHKPTLRLASSMAAQNTIKHFLTQGDTLLVSLLSTPHAQGVYALASNYGGLVARLLLQPVEESCRAYFSRLLSDPSRAAATRASADLARILRVYLVVAVPVVAIAPLFAEPVLAVVAGRKWADEAGSALAAYCAYIPLLALNGVLEAFVASVAGEGEVHRQSAAMAGFSLVFGASAFVALRVLPVDAGVGLVLANGVNMLCRIAWCAWFVGRYFKGKGVRFDVVGLLPGGVTVGVCLVGRYAIEKGVEVVGVEGGFMGVLVMGGMAVPVACLL